MRASPGDSTDRSRTAAADALLGDIKFFQKLSNTSVRAVTAALAAGGRGDLGFYLSDAFDEDLGIAREELAREQAGLDTTRGRESERIALGLARDAIESDEFIVMRSDLSGTLPEGVRVEREAPTYLLCALQYGAAAVAALARRDAAAQQLATVEARVRGKLSALIREHAGGLESAALALGELDVLAGAAALPQHYGCTEPAIVDEPLLAFERARFLPLESELAQAGRGFVPLDLELRETGVLTGPNMEGRASHCRLAVSSRSARHSACRCRRRVLVARCSIRLPGSGWGARRRSGGCFRHLRARCWS